MLHFQYFIALFSIISNKFQGQLPQGMHKALAGELLPQPTRGPEGGGAAVRLRHGAERAARLAHEDVQIEGAETRRPRLRG